MKTKREPQKTVALTVGTLEGWWYENRNSIDICVEISVKIDPGTVQTVRRVGQVRIHRRQLKDWIERTEPR